MCINDFCFIVCIAISFTIFCVIIPQVGIKFAKNYKKYPKYFIGRRGKRNDYKREKAKNVTKGNNKRKKFYF
jgi:hypothetical protein